MQGHFSSSSGILCTSQLPTQSAIAAELLAVSNARVTGSQKTVVSFVATYLKPEMLHVYRQTTNLRRYTNWIVTRRRENEIRFPAENVIALRRHPLRWFQRTLHRVRGLRSPLDPAENKQLAKICAEKKARLIHIYFGTEAARCVSFLSAARLPRIVSFHGADLSEKLTPSEMSGILANSDLFLCRSKALAEELVKRGVDISRIRLNYTGVPVPEDCHSSASNQSVRVLQACRFLPKKGLETTLRAVAKLRSAGSDIRLTLAGDGREKDKLEELAADLGISRATVFAGFLGESDLSKTYLKHDIFVHPSRTTESGDREGIPNSLLEAMAHGLPVIATKHSGIPEAVTQDKTGLLIDQSDPDLLAESIKLLASSPSERSRIGSAARREVIDRFSIAACVRALEDAYDEVIGYRQ